MRNYNFISPVTMSQEFLYLIYNRYYYITNTLFVKYLLSYVNINFY